MDNVDDEDFEDFLSQDMDDGEEDIIQYISIWDCPKIAKLTNEDNQKVWTCGWCPDGLDGSRPKPFSGWNNLKAICHVTGLGRQSIHQCRGKVPVNYHCAYHQLYLQFELAKDARSKSKEQLSVQISDLQEVSINSQ
jgi:hypothetical protein